jgi:glyoxylase-like metal-dependent hydrolase (beta-lactamase superfamily II)
MSRWMRAAALLLSVSWLPQAGYALQPHSGSNYAVISGKTYKFEQIADGVYYVPSHGFGSNDVVIVNEHDVVLIDTADTPAAMRALLDDLKVVTDKPVRYVVDTHWHFDHVDGNSVFGPEVQIIGHEFLRHALESFDVLHREPYASMGAPDAAAQVAKLEHRLADAGAGERERLQHQLAEARQLQRDYAEVTVVPPNLTYTDKLILHRGGREIDLLFLGRGHTGGDTVVYLPKERIVCSGDLMETTLPYMGDAYFDEWITTLGALERIDFAVDLPGHGVPFSDKGLIRALQAYLRDFIAQGEKLRAQGVTAEQAAQRIDLTAYAKSFPEIKAVGAPMLDVQRLYVWLGERHQSNASK